MKTNSRKLLSFFISLIITMCMLTVPVQVTADNKMMLFFQRIQASAGQDIQMNLYTSNQIAIREIKNLRLIIPDGFEVTGMEETSPAFNGTVTYELKDNYLNFNIESNGNSDSNIAATINIHVSENCTAGNHDFQWSTNYLECSDADGNNYTPTLTFGRIVVDNSGDTTTTTTTTTTETATTAQKHTYSVNFLDEETGETVSGVRYGVSSYSEGDDIDHTIKTSDGNPYYFDSVKDTITISLTVDNAVPDGYYIPDGATHWEISANNPNLTVFLRKYETTTSTTTTTETTTTTNITTFTTTETITTKYTYSVQFVDENGQAVSGVRYNIYSYDLAHDLAVPVQTSGETPKTYEFISDTAYITLSTHEQALPDGYYIPENTTRWELSADNPNLTVYLYKSTSTVTLPAHMEITIDSYPTKTTYTIGEELDLSGGTFHSDGTDSNGIGFRSINNNMENNDKVDISEFDSTKAGTYRIFIRMQYEELSAETFFEVTVTDNAGNLNLGDINSDGFIDSVDSSMILTEYALLSTSGIGEFTENQKKAADLNNDGITDSVDASLILAYYAYASTNGTDSIEKWLASTSL